jgi:hypothetical protein
MATLKEIIEYSKANPDSDYAKKAFETIQSGAFDTQAQTEGIDLSPLGRPKAASVAAPVKDERNLVQKTAGVFLDPILESGARFGQAVGAVGLKGANYLSGGHVDEYIKKTTGKSLDEALSDAMNTPSKLPLTGGELKPQSQETVENVLGRGVSTVALGLGNPVLSGAAIGVGSAMEKDKGVGEVALTGIVSALGAKVLAVGLGAAAPYIEKAAVKFGTPVLEKLQAQLPEYAKPYLEGLINKGNTALKNAGLKEFDAATDLVKEGGQIEFSKARELAWTDLQPKTIPTVKGRYGKAGNVSEQGLFTKAKIKPSEADEPIIEAYQGLYDKGIVKDSMSVNEKLTAIEQEATKLNQDQKAFLAANDKAVSVEGSSAEKGLLPTLGETSKKNSLIFAKDAKGAYDSAIEVFKSKLQTGKAAGATEGATTLTKIDEALMAFDNEMEKFGAWERSKSGILTETDRARIQAIRDIHDTARDFIAENLPANNPWKSIRLKESYLYQAADRVGEKLGDTVGNSKTTTFFKQHPNLKKGVWWIGGGLGAKGLLDLTQ